MDFTLSTARRFSSSKEDPLGLTGLKKLSPLNGHHRPLPPLTNITVCDEEIVTSSSSSSVLLVSLNRHARHDIKVTSNKATQQDFKIYKDVCIKLFYYH